MNYLTENESSNTAQFANVGQEVEKTRALQEVQGAIFMARQFPRNEVLAARKIMESAKRLTLAEKATYCFPRGGQQVKGASVRAAEAIAKYWGNISYGIKELSQNTADHSSEVLAYAWDLESNVRAERVFKVPHIRYSKAGGNTILTDPRDIYEKIANDGARRKRAVLLEILPGDVVEDFLNECEKTLIGSNTKPLKERVNDMLKMFEELGVTQEMIEKRVGTKCDNFIPKNIVDLGGVYNSIKNNFAPLSQFFDVPSEAEKQREDVEKKLTAKKSKKTEGMEIDPEFEAMANDYFEKNEKETV
jgi:hypothetical protein|uniref:Uncharacterized protein n=1 Tax=Myoviridae sp. ctsip2 TaxID=2826705 RepID=A0A8S5N5X7_9CAUD|nr:MAG TPA: hypothetical protein [Myoviridae sp. ctsip2]